MQMRFLALAVWYPDKSVFFSQFPSCEELTEWAKVVLCEMAPLTDLSEVDTKTLLSIVTEGHIQIVMDEKRTELAQMEKMLENRLELLSVLHFTMPICAHETVHFIIYYYILFSLTSDDFSNEGFLIKSCLIVKISGKIIIKT